MAQVEAGNIDIHNRPVVKNKDGSISTVRTIGVDFDGVTYNIPTVHDKGYIMSEKEAVDHFRKTGKHLGAYSSREEASEAAQKLHEDQADEYGDQDEEEAAMMKAYKGKRK